jgi:peptide/nickel transport system permease protein
MVIYVIRRLVVALFMVIGVAAVSFFVIKLQPGDYATRYKAFLLTQAGTTEEQAEHAAQLMRQQYGLDQPAIVQFGVWMKGIVTEGKFGFSFAYKKDVGIVLAERMPKTILLATLCHLISTILGLGIGIFVAPRKYGFWDNIAAVVSLIFTSVPRFWIALVILYLMVFVFKGHTIVSFFSPEYVSAPWSLARVKDMFEHIWPVLVIAGLGGVARNMRVMRGNLLDVLSSQFVTTARSKGLSETNVMMRHAVPNALHPIIAYQGTVLPYMLQGELEAAIVLNLPTMAPMFYESLVTQDIYIAGCFLLIYGVLIVLGNLIADLSLAVLDPRIRFN